MAITQDEAEEDDGCGDECAASGESGTAGDHRRRAEGSAPAQTDGSTTVFVLP